MKSVNELIDIENFGETKNPLTQPRTEEIIIFGLVLCCVGQQNRFDIFWSCYIESKEIEPANSEDVQAIIIVKTDKQFKYFCENISIKCTINFRSSQNSKPCLPGGVLPANKNKFPSTGLDGGDGKYFCNSDNLCADSLYRIIK
jgi:hypothetical protein